MAKPDIAFVSPPSRAMTPRPPSAFMYMASFLEENGVSAAIVDIKEIGDRNKAMEKTVEETAKLKPEMVGLTCLTPEVLETRRLAARLKQELPEAKLLVGGVHATLIPSDLLYRKSQIDFAVLGEGEETILELANAIMAGKGFNKVKGIAFLNKAGKVVKTEPRPLMDIGKLPLPAFEKIDMNFYTRPGLYCIRGIPISGFFVFTSRGCPYRCKFCVNKNIFGRVIRYRQPKQVVDEIELLAREYKIDGFFIYDDTFAVDKKHVDAICDGIKERNLDLIWGCQTRVNLVTEDLMRKMKQAGCVQVEFGVESGSPENLLRLRKDITVPQIENAFRICKKLKFKTFANFMINTPDETEEDVQMTIDLARKLDADINLFNVTTPYPGSEIYDKIGGIPLEEYESLAVDPSSYKNWLSMRDSKYKLSKHNIKLEQLVQDLAEEFPNIHQLSFKNPKYVAKLLKNISFLFTPRYLKVLMKSKRKTEYAKWAAGLGKYIQSQKNA